MKPILLSALFLVSVSSIAFAGDKCADPGTDFTMNKTETSQETAKAPEVTKTPEELADLRTNKKSD